MFQIVEVDVHGSDVIKKSQSYFCLDLGLKVTREEAVVVNIISQLEWAMECSDSWLTLCLGVSVRMMRFTCLGIPK